MSEAPAGDAMVKPGQILSPNGRPVADKVKPTAMFLGKDKTVNRRGPFIENLRKAAPPASGP